MIPATTVVVLLAHDDHFACLWAGDSRAYLLREGVLCQLTTDHSMVQELVTAGEVDSRILRVRADAARTGATLPPEASLRQQLMDALIDERVIISHARDSGMRVEDR